MLKSKKLFGSKQSPRTQLVSLVAMIEVASRIGAIWSLARVDRKGEKIRPVQEDKEVADFFACGGQVIL